LRRVVRRENRRARRSKRAASIRVILHTLGRVALSATSIACPVPRPVVRTVHMVLGMSTVGDQFLLGGLPSASQPRTA
jgi:hypothetical protein